MLIALIKHQVRASVSSESLQARDSHFYCFLSDYRARIFDSACLRLVFLEDPVSGSDFTNRRKSRARILKTGSRRLGECRILPFYTPFEGNWEINPPINFCDELALWKRENSQ